MICLSELMITNDIMFLAANTFCKQNFENNLYLITQNINFQNLAITG